MKRSNKILYAGSEKKNEKGHSNPRSRDNGAGLRRRRSGGEQNDPLGQQMSSPDQPSAPPPNMFGAPHRASPPAVHTATASSGQSPGQAGIGGARNAASRSPAGHHTEFAPGADRWVLLDGDGEPGRRKALPSPLQHTEADLADMRIRNLLEENQQLRCGSALPTSRNSRMHPVFAYSAHARACIHAHAVLFLCRDGVAGKLWMGADFAFASGQRCPAHGQKSTCRWAQGAADRRCRTAGPDQRFE